MDEVSGTLKNEHRNENENDETHTACGWLADTGLRSLCWLGERILIYTYYRFAGNGKNMRFYNPHCATPGVGFCGFVL